jgi:two-component system nitrate/nitrite response regulator NarL
MSGAECTRRVKSMLPGVPVVVLTVFEDRASIIEAICAGADGYLLKRTSAQELLAPTPRDPRRRFPAVCRHGAHRARARSPCQRAYAPSWTIRRAWCADRAAAPTDALQLTDREREVLACLVRGMSYKAVARALDISIDTVRSHIRVVYDKLQVHSVAEAVSRALQNGLV